MRDEVATDAEDLARLDRVQQLGVRDRSRRPERRGLVGERPRLERGAALAGDEEGIGDRLPALVRTRALTPSAAAQRERAVVGNDPGEPQGVVHGSKLPHSPVSDKLHGKRRRMRQDCRPMPFQVRSIQVAVDLLRELDPDEPLNTPEQFEHYDTIGAWSYDPVGEWASSPPFSVLYQQRDPLGHSEEVLTNPNKLLDYANFGGAIATWNANGTGKWAHSPGEWIIVDVELVQEQADDDDDDYFDDEEGGGGGNYVSVIFALWKVSEGWAAAVWRPVERDTLVELIGLDEWPTEGWEDCRVWYGE